MPSTITEWATLITAIATLAFVVIAVFELIALKKQLKNSFYNDYTLRYQHLILGLNDKVYDKDFSFDNLTEKEKNKIMRNMRAYYDLCYEEYSLNINGRIDKVDWEDWESGMKHAFKRTAFKAAWEIIKADSQFGKGFIDFVENINTNQK